MRALGISTSPRSSGNSDQLLCRALEGAASKGAQSEYLYLGDFNIGPCTECNACSKTGTCVIRDDYQKLLDKILSVDCFFFASPVFFSSVCAQAKVLIDRAQCMWARKYTLKQSPPPGRTPPRAMVIAVGGSRSKKQFECVKFTMKYYFDALDFDYWFNLFVSRTDTFDNISDHPSAMDEAFRLGVELASNARPESIPLDIELF